jgi:hypothetical protein
MEKTHVTRALKMLAIPVQKTHAILALKMHVILAQSEE